MAYGAVTGSHRAVNHFHVRLVVHMTFETELADGFLDKLFFRVGLMGIVTIDTPPLLNWAVDDREIVVVFMTKVTEFLSRCLEFEIRFHRFCGMPGVPVRMAHDTLADFDRPVDELCLSHIGMAIGADTFLRERLRQRPWQDQHDNEKNDYGS